MNASNKLDQYLAQFSQRLKKLTMLQGIAAIAVALLVFAVIGAYFAIESGYAGNTVIISRIILLLALTAVGVRFLAQPLQRIKISISEQVEARSNQVHAANKNNSPGNNAKGFEGRIETYVQMKATNSPFLELLAEDTLKVSEAYPVTKQIESKELGMAGIVTAAAMAILVYLMIAGPGNLNYSLRHLFAGWAINDLLPPQSIVVSPGDQSLRRGANLRITAEMEGFAPGDATIHIQSGDSDWQEVALVQSSAGFEFTFFSMQEEMAYYISSAGIRSPEYDIHVVDVPAIENLSLTYHYPEWSQRDAETFTYGDINTLSDTRIELTITTSSPLNAGELILNDDNLNLSLNGNEASTEFTVNDEGEYFIAAIVGGEQVRLSDDYFIRITEDGKPVIEFVRPGGDYNASSIEEVLTRIEANDDYGLEQVELNYSINGGEWLSVDLPTSGRNVSAEHLFMLEDMRTEAAQTVSRNVGAFNIVLGDEPEILPSAPENPALQQENDFLLEAEAAAIEKIPLQPGDLISYYAQTSDRTQTVRTDMFFIQIQSFNRRYTQSQISGGGGGGGAGGQDEISQRQRQIIVSTWNLVREQSENDANAQVEINSSLLSELQLTLAEQAQTLAQRTRARQLDNDQDIEKFVQYLEQAIQSMYPSSELLASTELEDALQPAQEALQYLLRAEAIFNDITVTQQEGGGGGGGGASQDLAEMFELEMDLEKNQYEAGNSASPQAQQQQEDDIMSQLDELAQRQEQLANNLRNQQQITEAQKYQQEMLRREVEELQEQLERMQEQSQSQQQASNSQDGQQGQQGQGGQQGQNNSEDNQDQEPQVAEQSALQQRLDSALRAMEDSANAMNGNPSQEELQRAADEAQRQLEGARDQVAQDQLDNIQEAFASMSDQAQQMLVEQQQMEQALQDAVTLALEERESGEDPNSRGMSLEDAWALAAEKQELVADLQSLQQQMINSTQRFDEQVPEAARALQQANNELSESELEQAIADAALYIDSGYGLYIAGNESNITAGVRDLAGSLERAQQLASNAAARGDTALDRAQEQARSLRVQLQEQLAQQGGQPGQGEGQSEAEGQQQGQSGQGQQPSSSSNGSPQRGSRQAAGNGWDNTGDALQNRPIDITDDFFGDVDELTQSARDSTDQLDLTPEQLDEMNDLIQKLEFTRLDRQNNIAPQEFSTMLALIEQLEASLQIAPNDSGSNNVRTAVAELIPEQYRESVAEYYRRLSTE